MPSKKRSKGKGKGKGKKTGKVGGKLSKKLMKKYGPIQYENAENSVVSITAMRRDELELAAEKLREQVSLFREERVKYQMERDFLKSIAMSHLKKYKCLLSENESKFAEINHAEQETANASVIKSVEGKHFRYECQFKATQMDIRNEFRKKNLQAWLNRSWQSIAMEMDELYDLEMSQAAEHREKVEETESSLQDLDKFVDDHDQQLVKYKSTLAESMENSLNLFKQHLKMDYIEAEERFDEFIWNLSKNFEFNYANMKNYYNDITHNNLTLILSMRDTLEYMNENKQKLKGELTRIKREIIKAKEQVQKLGLEFKHAKLKHETYTRLKRGFETTTKALERIKNLIDNLNYQHHLLAHQFTQINEERQSFKEGTSELAMNIIEEYSGRYEHDMYERAERKELESWNNAHSTLVTSPSMPNQQFGSQVTAEFHKQLNRVDLALEKQRLKALTLIKQHDDMNNSVGARMDKISLSKKHKTSEMFPRPNLVGKCEGGVSWSPAGLVANKSYPLKAMIEQQNQLANLPTCDDKCNLRMEDEDNGVCMTNSMEKLLELEMYTRKLRNNSVITKKDKRASSGATNRQSMGTVKSYFKYENEFEE